MFFQLIFQRIKVSAGFQLATLRYNSSLPEHSWLRQIMDMFNVEVSNYYLRFYLIAYSIGKKN